MLIVWGCCARRISTAFVLGLFAGIGVCHTFAFVKLLKFYSNGKRFTSDAMEELQQPWVHMKDSVYVHQVIDNIIADGKDGLQVVADFDRTLTRFSYNGHIVPTCHAILDNSKLLPGHYKERADKLRAKYYPIEIDSTLTSAQKIPYMIEWWTKAHTMMGELQLRKDDLHRIVHDSGLMLREHCDWSFERLHELNVPLLIFSAGIGDIIYEGISLCAKFHDNMKIVSNFMHFNGQGVLTGFHGDLIHSFNKNENAIHDSDYFEKLSARHNVILLGDTMGDLSMADGALQAQNCLKIGFLNDKIEDRLASYMEGFDIVLVGDNTMDVLNAILRRI